MKTIKYFTYRIMAVAAIAICSTGKSTNYSDDLLQCRLAVQCSY